MIHKIIKKNVISHGCIKNIFHSRQAYLILIEILFFVIFFSVSHFLDQGTILRRLCQWGSIIWISCYLAWLMQKHKQSTRYLYEIAISLILILECTMYLEHRFGYIGKGYPETFKLFIISFGSLVSG